MYYDISAIKDRMNICDTCDNLGIQRKRSGANFSIPCPNPSHFEHKHDNCFVFPDSGRFHCFSCGATGDLIGLIMTYRGYSFGDAVECAAEMSGCGADLTGRKKKDILRFLTLDECEFLGIHNEPVYSVKTIADYHLSDEELGSKNGYWDTDGYSYAFLECTIPNPLRLLWEKDPKSYKELIRNKAYERIGVYRQIGKGLKYDVSEYLKKAADLFMGFGGMYDSRKEECIEYL